MLNINLNIHVLQFSLRPWVKVSITQPTVMY